MDEPYGLPEKRTVQAKKHLYSVRTNFQPCPYLGITDPYFKPVQALSGALILGKICQIEKNKN